MISNLEHVSPLGKGDHCVLNFDFNCYANICTQPKTVKMHNNRNNRDFNQEIKTILVNWESVSSSSIHVDCFCWDELVFNVP
jgi:hypothetical protein